LEGKIRIGAVSYLNTKPLIYALEQGTMKDQLDLFVDYPSKIALQLMNNEIDAGLVPVAIVPYLKDHYIISDYCIGCDGEVASVCLFSEVPLEQVKTILLDYQSRSSVELLKILIREYWKIDVTILETSVDYQDRIKGTTAGLVIGDRAFEQRRISPYIYDLGLAWKLFTGMPFVFAAWISNKKLDPYFIHAFNAANREGLDQLDKVIAENPGTLFDLRAYYTNYINYNLDENKKSGMNFFLGKLSGSRHNNTASLINEINK
jgi:chorismate dehydratase